MSSEQKQEVYLTEEAIDLLKKDAQKTHIALEDKETHTFKHDSYEDLKHRDFYVNDETKQKLQDLLDMETTDQHNVE